MFSKETEYALRSLVYIKVQNKNGKKPGVVEISTEIEAPQFYTAKILQNLVRKGLLMSQKGKGGGFYFDEKSQPLLLKEVIEITQGDKIFTACGFGLKKCDCENPCPLHLKYSPIREAIKQLVNTESIGSLAEKI